MVICSAFRRFTLGIRYFLALLNPLFPGVPVLTVVKYGVKKRFPTRGGRYLPVPARKRFSLVWVWGIVPLPQRLSKSFLRDRRINFSHAYSKNKSLRTAVYLFSSHWMPAAVPLDPLDKMVSRIQLEHCVDALALVKSLDFLCILLNCFQNRIACLGLPVPQGEIDAVRPALRLVGEDVLFETRKPQGARRAPHP